MLYAILTVLISSCDNSSNQTPISQAVPSAPKQATRVPSPKEVLSNYLDGTLHGKLEKAYECLSQQDMDIKNKEDFFLSNTIEGTPFLKSITSRIKYEITDITTDNNSAKAAVTISSPDLSSVFIELFGTALQKAFTDTENTKQEAEFEKLITEKFKEENIPTTISQETFSLIKENGEWKVFLDLATKEKTKNLLAEAKELKENNKLHGALSKYEEVLKLDSTMVEAAKGKEETQKAIEVFEEKQAYIQNVELYGLTSKYHTTYLDEKVPGVNFKIKNNGDKTLNKIKVTVFFKDSSGNIIAEEDYTPVYVSSYSFGDNKPLKPNYIWQIEQGKFYRAKSVPSEWAEGSVSAKITDIEFE